jgi:hypothetical protein
VNCRFCIASRVMRENCSFQCACFSTRGMTSRTANLRSMEVLQSISEQLPNTMTTNALLTVATANTGFIACHLLTLSSYRGRGRRPGLQAHRGPKLKGCLHFKLYKQKLEKQNYPWHLPTLPMGQVTLLPVFPLSFSSSLSNINTVLLSTIERSHISGSCCIFPLLL